MAPKHLAGWAGTVGSLLLWGSLPAWAGDPVRFDGSTQGELLDAATGLPGSNCSQSCIIRGSSIAGGNLFHSFSDLNVESGVTVTFEDSGVARILSRVTGGNPTKIRGLLRVDGNADLFLLNPDGILIEADGQLDLRGSFIGTTAEVLEFADGNFLEATNSNPPILTLSVPIGLQFQAPPPFSLNSATAGEIVVSGHSTLQPLWKDGTVGRTFALISDENRSFLDIGRDFLFGNTISSFEKRSHQVTAGGFVLSNVGTGNQTVALSEVAQGWEFDFSETSGAGKIDLEEASITTSPFSLGGNVNLYGDIKLDETHFDLTASGSVPAGSFFFSGKALELDESSIRTVTESGGGANVSIVASQGITFEESELVTSTLLDGANVTLQTNGRLKLEDGAFISLNSGEGQNAGLGGNLLIAASQVVSDAANQDNDIKLVGPQGNFTYAIANNQPFVGFDLNSTAVVRGNNRSEIQITILPFPPQAPPSPELQPGPNQPGLKPEPNPPEPPPAAKTLNLVEILAQAEEPTVIMGREGETIFAGNGILATLATTGLLTFSQGGGGDVLNVATLALQPETDPTYQGELVARAVPTSEPAAEEVEAGNFSDRSRTAAAYEVRRPSCNFPHDSSKATLSLTGRGGLPDIPSSLVVPSLGLADLGPIDSGPIDPGIAMGAVSHGGKDSAPAKGSPEPNGEGEGAIYGGLVSGARSQLLEAGAWQILSSGKIQLVAQGTTHPSAALWPKNQACQA